MIINLTEHPTTDDEREDGVVDVAEFLMRGELMRLLDFEGKTPTEDELRKRAASLAKLAEKIFIIVKFDAPRRAMIGRVGGLNSTSSVFWLIEPLAKALRKRGIEPLFANSQREWTELTADGGPVTSGYRHIGFVPVRT